MFSSHAQAATTISGAIRLPTPIENVTVLHVEVIGYDSNKVELSRTNYVDGFVRVSSGSIAMNYNLDISDNPEVTQYSVRATCISEGGQCDNIEREQHFTLSGLINIFEADNEDLFIAKEDLPTEIDFRLVAGGTTVLGNIFLETPNTTGRRLTFIINISNDVNFDISIVEFVNQGEQSVSFKFSGLIDALGHDHRITWVCSNCGADYVTVGESEILASGQDHDVTLGVSQQGILLSGTFTLTEGFAAGELVEFILFEGREEGGYLSVGYQLILNPDDQNSLKATRQGRPIYLSGLSLQLSSELQIPGNRFDHAVLMPANLPARYSGELALYYYCQDCIDSVVSVGYFTSQPSLPSATSQESLQILVSAQEPRSDLHFGLIYQYIPPPFETLIPSMLLLLDDQQP